MQQSLINSNVLYDKSTNLFLSQTLNELHQVMVPQRRNTTTHPNMQSAVIMRSVFFSKWGV